MKAKIPKPLSKQQRHRAATWHVKRMSEILDVYGKLVLESWVRLNTLLEMKRELKDHIGEFQRMTKGKP